MESLEAENYVFLRIYLSVYPFDPFAHLSTRIVYLCKYQSCARYMYTCIYIHISVIHIYRRNHRDRMMVMLIWFGLESIRERGIIEQVREGEEWVIEVLIFRNCYPRGMHTSRKSGNDFSGQKQVSHCRETNKFTVNRNYHLFLCFATDNWIRSFFLPFFRIYIKPVRITYNQKMHGKKERVL